MGGATREFYLHVLREALEIIGAARAKHVVIGSVATRALLEMPLSETEDVDVLIRHGDADGLLDLFAREGYATYRRDESWIYKAARPDVTIDLIFRAGESIRLDDEHLSHSRTRVLEGISLRLPGPEDLAVMKAVFDGVDRQGRWYGALSLFRRFPIDWDYLAERGIAHAPRRVLSLLLYAADEGIVVPDRSLSKLIPAATASEDQQDQGLAFAVAELNEPSSR